MSSSPDGFTLESILTVGGQSVQQTQYVGADFVVSRIGSMILHFDASTGVRSFADPRARCLRSVDDEIVHAQAIRQRERLGDVTVIGPERVTHTELGVIDRYRYFNHAPLMVVRGSLLVKRDPRFLRSALVAERSSEAANAVFHLPLDDDQIVLESRTRSVAPEFEQSASYRLLSIEEGVKAPEWVLRVLGFSVVSSAAA